MQEFNVSQPNELAAARALFLKEHTNLEPADICLTSWWSLGGDHSASNPEMLNFPTLEALFDFYIQNMLREEAIHWRVALEIELDDGRMYLSTHHDPTKCSFCHH